MKQSDADREVIAGLPYISLEELCTPVFEEEDVVLPILGKKVRVRAISREELHDCRERSKTKDTKGNEVYDDQKLEMYLCIAAVVNPPLTEAAYAHLKKQNSATIQAIFNAVARLGGLNDTALTDAERLFLDGLRG